MEAIEEGRHAQPPEGSSTTAAPAQARALARRDRSAQDAAAPRAEAAGVAPRLIANADDIERLAAHEDEGVAALHGWRAEVFGNDAIALRKGDLAIALENGDAVVVELEEE